MGVVRDHVSAGRRVHEWWDLGECVNAACGWSVATGGKWTVARGVQQRVACAVLVWRAGQTTSRLPTVEIDRASLVPCA